MNGPSYPAYSPSGTMSFSRDEYPPAAGGYGSISPGSRSHSRSHAEEGDYRSPSPPDEKPYGMGLDSAEHVWYGGEGVGGDDGGYGGGLERARKPSGGSRNPGSTQRGRESEMRDGEEGGSGKGRGGQASAKDAADKGDGGDQFKRKMACMSCRLIKLRCLLHSPTSHPLDPCRRCVKMNIECEYKPKRRPVKPGKAAGSGADNAGSRTGSVDIGGAEGGNAAGSPKQAGQGTKKASTSARANKQAQALAQAQAQASGSSEPSPASLDYRAMQSGANQVVGGGSAGFDVDRQALNGRGYGHEHQGSSFPGGGGGGGGELNAYGQYGLDHGGNVLALDPVFSQPPPPNIYDAGSSSLRDVTDTWRRRQPDAIPMGRAVSEERTGAVGQGSSSRSGMGGPFGAYNLGGMGSGGYAGGLSGLSGHPISSARAGTSIDESADGGYYNDGMSNMRSTGNLAGYQSTPPSNNGSTALPSMPRHVASYGLPGPDAVVINGDSTGMATFSASSGSRDRERVPSTPSGEDAPPRERTPDPTRAKMRPPMALASILDLIRKDLSPPPGHSSEAEERQHTGGSRDEVSAANTLKRRHSPEHIGEIYGSGSRDSVGGGSTGPRGHAPGERSEYGDRLMPPGRPEKKTRWQDEEAEAGPSESARSTEHYRTFGVGSHRANELDQSSAMDHRTAGSRHADDPVVRGLISQDEVQFLFTRYFECHNTYIALLDISLHTPEYCLETSVVLFVAILTVAANAFIPGRYAGLLTHVNDMLGEAFKRADVEIGLCQALSLLSVWKDGSDRGSFLRVGYAIRIGYELGLDAPPLRPLSEDDLRARQTLNKERTWWQLTMFDRTMYHMHGQRPRMINVEEARGPVGWARDHPEHPCYSDSMLAASYDSGKFLLILSGRNKQDPVGTSYRMILHRLQVENSEWAVTWLGSDPPVPLHPTSRTIIGFYLHTNNFEIAEYARLGVPESDSLESLSDSVAAAIQLLRYIVDELEPAEVLRFAPDVITIRAAKCGVFLARNMSKIPPILVEEIFSVFKQLVRCCKRASNGQDTAYFQAKFFTSLLRVSSVAPTRAGSRIGSPLPTSSTRTGGKASTPSSNGVPGDVLAARLSESLPPTSTGETGTVDRGQIPTDDLFQDMDFFPFDEQLSIDALLQESHDWFSLDLMSHINDPSWANQPVITLPGPYGLTSNDPSLAGQM